MKKRLVLGLALTVPGFAADTDIEADCRADLKRLGAAVLAYRIIHNDKNPTKFSDLYSDGFVESLGEFTCAASAPSSASEIDAKTDYTFESLPDTEGLLVREKTPREGVNTVLAVFADGAIEAVTVAATARTATAAIKAPTGAGTELPSGAEADSAPPVIPYPTAPPDAATTSSGTKANDQVVSFDDLAAGELPLDAFASFDLRVIQGTGSPLIAKGEPNMILPEGRDQVLLIGGDRVTSLTFAFNVPVKRFSLWRIGTAGGASVPTWRLDAYDGAGTLIDSIGEEHGLPQTPVQFAVEGSGIARVQLSTDNRFGDATWATWNSLPIAGIQINR